MFQQSSEHINILIWRPSCSRVVSHPILIEEITSGKKAETVRVERSGNNQIQQLRVLSWLRFPNRSFCHSMCIVQSSVHSSVRKIGWVMRDELFWSVNLSPSSASVLRGESKVEKGLIQLVRARLVRLEDRERAIFFTDHDTRTQWDSLRMLMALGVGGCVSKMCFSVCVISSLFYGISKVWRIDRE